MKLRLGKLVLLWGDKCQTEECDYYTHYLRYGPAAMSHVAYHKAIQECLIWQERYLEALEDPKRDVAPLERIVTRLEQEVRA